MPIYSPSATTTFARCPQLWQFYREGWQPKHIGRLEVSAAYGVGFAKAMEVIFRTYPEQTIAETGRAVLAGIESAQSYIQNRLDNGGVVGNDNSNITAIPDRLTKAILAFIKRWNCPQGWHSFMPELVFPEHGNCRVDLLCQSDFGPCIVDFKTNLTKPQPYVLESRLAAFEHSWQFYHYVWAAREMGIDVRSFSVVIVSFEPFSISQDQWVVDEEYLAQWKDSAIGWWGRMDYAKDRGLYDMAPDHSDKYGLCRYADVCLQGDRWNPERWERSLIHVERD